MSELSVARLQRRRELYGPGRCLMREAAKVKLVEDHVKQNFQNGDFGDVHGKCFHTTTAGNFQHEQVLPYHRVKPSNKTCIHFGSDDHQHQESVTMSDFPGIPISQHNISVPKVTPHNFADFSSRYGEVKTMGSSVYNSDFDGGKSFATLRASRAKEGGPNTQSTMKYHIGTHFNLGSDVDKKPESETTHSFSGDGDYSNPYVSTQSRSKSYVFRLGDYNMASPNTDGHFMSVQKKDFVHSGEVPSDVKASEEGQHDTNFILGYDEKERDSVYMKDFSPSRLKGATKPPRPCGLPCSKVMHEFPVVSSSSNSVSKQDFGRHQLESGKFEGLEKIKKRHTAVAVDFNCGGGNEDHPITETMESFSSPQCAEGTQHVIPVHKDYHHLETNRALPEGHPLLKPDRSEVQDSFAHPIKSEEEYTALNRAKLGERTTRIRENKMTHFVLGSDPLQRETEQMAQFVAKKPLDPVMMAAGKPDLPTKGYSLISHDSGEVSVQAPRGLADPQQLIQQRNYLKNINPRDTANLNLRKAFLEYDKSLSGAISKDDLKLVCKNMNVDITESDLDEIIARCDTKGDGLIDYHEFAINLTRLQPPEVSLLQPPGITTITRQDFKPPSDQRMTAGQLWVLEKDAKRFEAVESQPPCLMQWAPEKDYLQSTKMKDYKEPDSVALAV